MESENFPARGSQNRPWINKLKTGRRPKLLVELEDQLHKANLWENPEVQRLYRLARFGTDNGSQRAIQALTELLQDYQEQIIRLEDFFLPYATSDQISNNSQGIHILDQFHNNIPMYAPDSSLPLGWMFLGRQGGGKSSAAFYILVQCIEKGLPAVVLDPKGTWRYRASQLRAEYINADYLSLELQPPDGIQLKMWLYAYMEGIAEITGLQYSISFLYQACDIAVQQRQNYIAKTGRETPLSLKDIYLALYLCRASNSKQQQYLQSAKSALDMLIRSDNVFSNRGGLPMDQLLTGNYILACRYLSSVQSRLVAWHILAYEYFRSFNLPETTRPRGITLFDDSSKFVSRPDTVFSSSGHTSSYMHILSNLRSTGRSVIFVDQLVDPIYSDIKQLCSNWLVIGGLQGANDLQQVAAAMNLTKEQAQMLVKFQSREAVAFCPKLYPRAVHGFIPQVPPPQGGSS